MKFERQPNEGPYSNNHMDPRSGNYLDDDIFYQEEIPQYSFI